MGFGEDWRSDLERWLEPWLAELSHPVRRRMCPFYINGLIGPGDRKSVQLMAAEPMLSWTVDRAMPSL